MKVRQIFLILGVIISISCTDAAPQSQTKKSNQSSPTDTIAVFDNGFGDEFVFERKNLLLESRVDHIQFKTRQCLNNELLLCLDSPYQLYLPKHLSTKIHVNSFGNTFDIEIVSSGETPTSKLICDYSGFWLKNSNRDTKTVNWYLLKQDLGLVRMLTFYLNKNQQMEPDSPYFLKSGNIFTQNEICE